MQELLEFFPIILYLLGSVLLVILIILSAKLIETVNKTNAILDDAYNKTKSLSSLFNAIDAVTDTLNMLSDSVVGSITNVIGKIFNKKNKKEIYENE